MTEHNEGDEAQSSDFFQRDADRKNILSKYLSQLHFQYKVIEFANYFIYKYSANITKDNKQEIKLLPTEKYNFYNSVKLHNK